MVSKWDIQVAHYSPVWEAGSKHILTWLSIFSQTHMNQTSNQHTAQNIQQVRWIIHLQRSGWASNRCDLIEVSFDLSFEVWLKTSLLLDISLLPCSNSVFGWWGWWWWWGWGGGWTDELYLRDFLSIISHFAGGGFWHKRGLMNLLTSLSNLRMSKLRDSPFKTI